MNLRDMTDPAESASSSKSMVRVWRDGKWTLGSSLRGKKGEGSAEGRIRRSSRDGLSLERADMKEGRFWVVVSMPWRERRVRGGETRGRDWKKLEEEKVRLGFPKERRRGRRESSSGRPTAGPGEEEEDPPPSDSLLSEPLNPQSLCSGKSSASSLTKLPRWREGKDEESSRIVWENVS